MTDAQSVDDLLSEWFDWKPISGRLNSVQRAVRKNEGSHPRSRHSRILESEEKGIDVTKHCLRNCFPAEMRDCPRNTLASRESYFWSPFFSRGLSQPKPVRASLAIQGAE